MKWTRETECAFEQVKDRFKKFITLSHPIHNAELSLYTDASQYAIGGYLTQKDPESG